MYGRRCRCSSSDSGIITFIACMLIAVYALPVVGIYLLAAGKSEGKRILGGVLTVVGIVLWIVAGIS